MNRRPDLPSEQNNSFHFNRRAYHLFPLCTDMILIQSSFCVLRVEMTVAAGQRRRKVLLVQYSGVMNAGRWRQWVGVSRAMADLNFKSRAAGPVIMRREEELSHLDEFVLCGGEAAASLPRIYVTTCNVICI